MKQLHLVRLPVAQRLHRGGPFDVGASLLQGDDGGAALPQVIQQLFAVMHCLLLRLPGNELDNYATGGASKLTF